MLKSRLENSTEYLLLGFATFAIYLSSLRPSFKYLDSLLPGIGFIILMSLLIMIANLLLRNILLARLVSSPSAWYLLIGILGTVTVFYYPLADGLKAQLGGWDQDDCLFLGVENLFRGVNPYQDLTYLGNPCSPGFGALALYFPFIVAGIFSLAPIAWMIGNQFIISRTVQDDLRAGIFVVVISSSPMTLELLVNGSDIVVMGFGLLLSGILLDWAIQTRKVLPLVFVGAFVGLVASMRINLILLVLVTGVYAFIRLRARGFWFTVSSGLVAVTPSLLIYLSNPDIFTPLHLVGKSQTIVPFPLYVLMALFTIVFLVIGSSMVSKKNLGITEFTTLVFAPHIILLSVSALAVRGWDFFNWEAAHYLYVLTPALAFIVSGVVVYMKNRFD